MTKFHSDDYIKFLRSIRPDNMSDYNKQMQRCKLAFFRTCFRYPSILRFSQIYARSVKHCLGHFFQRNLVTIFEIFFLFCTVNVGEDCPVFDGMYEFCQLSTGGSVGKLKSFSSQPLVGGGGCLQVEFYQLQARYLDLGASWTFGHHKLNSLNTR